ncbi:TonB-dependent receptor [Roseateles sp.]|uniref:TonB-dependent receptor n=1 Tax=Roseateles sp. TaxID=1971397 RepID=UPI003BAAFF0A
MGSSPPTAHAARLLCALAAAAPPAWAADEAGPASNEMLDKVVVTAQKREQAALDVPGSVTALGAERLSRGGLTRLEDYAAQVPGLSFSTAGQGNLQIVLRGLSTGLAQSAPTTALYIDEAPVGSVNAYAAGSQLAPDLDPADLSRIEVLKGPQGTMFGAGAVGGLVRFVTAAPDVLKAGGRLTVGASSVAHGGTGSLLRASANLPFASETMGLRVSGYRRKDAGFIDVKPGQADVNGATVRGARVAYAWHITPGWTLGATALQHQVRAGGPSTVDVDGRTLQPTAGDDHHGALIQEARDTELDLANVTVKGQVGDFNVVSSTTQQRMTSRAYQDMSMSYGVLLGVVLKDPDFGVGLAQNTRTHRLSQELRVQSTVGRLDWEAGLYYTQEDDTNRIPGFDTFSLATGAAKPVNIPGTGVPFPDGAAKARIDTRYHETSVFANASYALTEHWDLQAGVRHARDRQDYDQAYSGLLFTPNVVFAQSATHGKTTYLLTARFKPTATDSIYARAASGYRPGGPSAAPPTTGRPPVVGADSLTSAEAGWKTVAAGGKVSFEAAVFRTRWQDIQIQTSAQGANFFVNGGRARSQGLEATLGWHPLAALGLRASLGRTDARLTEDTTRVLLNAGTVAETPLGRRGDRLPFVPRATGSLGADYRCALSGGWAASVNGAVNRIGSRLSDYGGKAPITVPGYTTVHLGAAVENTTWRLSAYVKNLADRRGLTFLADRGLAPLTPNAPAAAGIVTPRTVGVEASAWY